MPELHAISPFIDSTAVEAWDAWFRWRDNAGLHDFSIEDTWRRVAAELASAEAETASWGSRLMSALSTWQLLPDERILASAGTGQITWLEGTLHASLNAAAFVSASGHARSRIDLAAVADCADLAVQALDNAALLAGIYKPKLCVGWIGVADALSLLGLGYDSDEARAMAGAIARALAEGCFRASTSLARYRGASSGNPREAIAKGAWRGLPENLLREAEDNGLRHLKLTAITSQQRLALLANVVANALDPLIGANHTYVFIAPGGERRMTSSGYALGMNHVDDVNDGGDVLGNRGWLPQLRLRAAMQPYMDEPICYPLLAMNKPDDRQISEATVQAAQFGLTRPAWRNASDTLYACDRPLL